MSIVINYKNRTSKKNCPNLLYFVNEEYDFHTLKNNFTKTEYSFLSDLIKSYDLTKKITKLDLNSKKKIILISIKKNISTTELENLGAEFYNYFKDLKKKELQINSDALPTKIKNLVGYFLHGFKLKSYTFEKYKTKKNIKNISINVIGKN